MALLIIVFGISNDKNINGNEAKDNRSAKICCFLLYRHTNLNTLGSKKLPHTFQSAQDYRM